MSEITNNNFDFNSLFEEDVKPEPIRENGAFDKGKWIEEKAIEREQAYASIEEMSERVSTNQKDFENYLHIASRFPKLTVQNQLLLLSQNPEASDLNTYDDWQNMGVSINKGEKGIVQLIKTGEYEKADGTMGNNYSVKKVFDVSQTDVELVKDDNTKPEVKLKALIKSSFNPVVGIKENANGEACFYDSDERTIYLANTGHIGEMYESLVREMALSYFDYHNEDYDRDDFSDKAECVGFIVSERNGFNREAPNLDRLDCFDGCDNNYDVRGVLTDINKCAGSITHSLDREKNEKNIDNQER